MSLTVLSATFYKNMEPVVALKNSCSRFGLSLVAYGIGKKFPGFYKAKVVKLLEALRKVETEYVLFCDGSDTVILKDEKTIVATYEKIVNSTGGEIVFGSDMKCFPYPLLTSVFEDRGKGYKASVCDWKGKKRRWVFLNAGVFMSTKRYLVQCLTRLMAMYSNDSKAVAHPEDDQGWWCMAIARGLVEVGIDYSVELSAMTKYTPDSWYSLSKGKCVQKPMNTEPCVLHFVGSKPMHRRMKGFLERMGL